MAFPASSITNASALQNIAGAAISAKNHTQTLHDASAAGDVPRRDFIELQENLQRAINIWDTNQSRPGLGQYAQDQYGDPTLDITAEYNAMRAAAISVRDWIFNAIPISGPDGASRIETVNNDASVTPIMVTTAQSAGFRTEALAFIATIT